MSSAEWLQIGSFVVTTGAAALLWSVRSAFNGGVWYSETVERMKDIERRAEDHSKIMQRAGDEMSKYGSKLQILPLIEYRLQKIEDDVKCLEDTVNRRRNPR